MKIQMRDCFKSKEDKGTLIDISYSVLYTMQSTMHNLLKSIQRLKGINVLPKLGMLLQLNMDAITQN